MYSILTLCACLVYITSANSQAIAADYYVSPAGSDSNSGAQSAPFRTITLAYSRAAAGDSIWVQPGTYTDFQSGWGLHLNKSGTASASITLKSVQRGMAIIDAANQSDRVYAFYVDGAFNVIDGFKITGAPNSAVTIWGSNNQFINNEIYNNGKSVPSDGSGNAGFYSDESTAGNYYGQNYVHDNGVPGRGLDHGLYLCGKNETVVNNIAVGHPGDGLQIAGYATVSGMKVYNNVFVGNGQNGIILWQSLNGVQIYNNILASNGKNGIDSYDAHGSGVSISNNLYYGNGSGAQNLSDGGSNFTYTLGSMIQNNPLFVSATDYHLQSSSPAIDAGTAVSGSQDYLGNPRPAGAGYDIGAFEYGSSGSASITPQPPYVSVLQNGSFANGWTDWGSFGNSAIVSSNGQYAISIGVAAGGIYQNLIGLAAGTYTLTFTGEVGSSADLAKVGVYFYDVNGNRLGNVETTYNNTSSQTMSLTIPVPSGVYNTQVYVWKSGGGSHYAFASNLSLSQN
jgi:hypothetical protein